MYPDKQDVQQTMHRLTGVPRPKAEDIWPTVVLVREFLSNAYQWCRNQGRHKYVPASELLQQAEKFIGRAVTPYEFCLTFFLALPAGSVSKRIPYSTPVDVAQFDILKIKFPPIARLEEFRETWTEIQSQTEKEIIQERQRLALQNIFFGQGTDADYGLLTEKQKREVAEYEESRRAQRERVSQ